MPTEELKPKKKKKWIVLLVLVIILIGGGLFFNFFMQIKQIRTGFIGVKSDIGNVVDNTVGHSIHTVNGYVVFMPLYSEVVVFPTTIRTAEYDAIRINAKDGTEFTIKPRVSYLLDEQGAAKFYKDFRLTLPELEKSYLKEIIAAAYVAAGGNFGSDSLVNNKNAFEQNAFNLLSVKMSDIGLVLKNSNANLEIPQKIKDIIALRSQTLQNAILAEDKVKQVEAESRIAIVQADAVRASDSLRHSALTPLAIQKMFIEKWDGKLPVYGQTPQIYKDITDTTK